MTVSKQDVLAASHGMLQRQFYIVFSTPAHGMDPVMANLPAHLEH